MWKDGYFRLFVSHVSKHKAIAHSLKAALASYHIDCFVAHDDIAPTREWEDEIEGALRSMDALAAVLTEDFHASKWTDQEVGFAFGSGRMVLPIRHGADPYGFIGKYQGYTIKAGVDFSTVAKEIATIVSRHANTSAKMAEALTGKFELASSWESAKSTMSLLEELPVIPEELLVRIKRAGKKNDQVESAWGVPDRISALVKKHKQIGQA